MVFWYADIPSEVSVLLQSVAFVVQNVIVLDKYDDFIRVVFDTSGYSMFSKAMQKRPGCAGRDRLLVFLLCCFDF